MSRGSVERTAADRCPGILALHRAEDGWLARIRLPGGRISPRQLEAVAAAAEIGSGLVELTARANLQVRGLPAAAGAELPGLLGGAGLLPSPAHDRARNVLASPLAGRHPRSLATTDEVVLELDRGLCGDPALSALSGRFLFSVDDGSGLALGHGADLTLVATPSARRASPAFALTIAGTPTTLRVAPPEAAGTALRAARAFLEVQAEHGEGAWRVREIADGAERVARRIGARTQAVAAPKAEVGARDHVLPGHRIQNDGRAAVTALAPLGRLDRGAVGELAALTRAYGGDVRLSPWRTLTVVDVAKPRAGALARALEALGLVVSAASGWTGLSTCAGLGFCANARLDVRAAAERRAAEREVGAPTEHWSACERRCGEVPGVSIAVSAGGRGLAVRAAGQDRKVSTAAEALALLGAEVARR
jgi:sulfite reductase beta subunit-like hemoprotein